MGSAEASAYSSFSALLLWVLFLLAAVAQNTSICFESTPRGDVQTLAQFKVDVLGITEVDFNNGGYNYNTIYFDSWNETDANPCAWVGVTCNANSTVQELDFSNWGILLKYSDSFSALCCLQGLRHLDLSSNGGYRWTLDIARDINSCTGLTYLDLSRNYFTGNIPNISGLQSLRYFSLEQNMLEGEMPNLQGLMNLQFLRLADNNLSGPIPTDLGEINSLVSIDLSNNSFNGTIPSLSGLTNLLEVRFDNNNFTKFVEPLFPDAKSLKYLSVSGNQLQGVIPPSITNILNLELLDMSQSQLSGEIPLVLSQNNLKKVFNLDLSKNQLTGSVPTELLRPSNVESLHINLSHNLLTGSIPVLSNGTNDSDAFSLALDLSYNYLSGPVPFIYDNISLISLSLQNNNLSGDIVNVLLNSPGTHRAVELYLQNNFFTGDLLGLLSSCIKFPYLGPLDLSNNNLQWNRIDSLTDPLRVVLDSCSFKQIRVAGNNLSGISLPGALNIVVSSFLNVYYNSLLEVLDLSNSHLTGTILDAVFNSTWFPNLQILNLSNNDLIGTFPESIVHIPNLIAINVSNNNLVGPLPPIQLNSILYNPSFISGNDGLCGEPLPPCTTRSRQTGVPWWALMVIVGGSMILVLGSCLVATWQWRVHQKKHKQDADLIKTLLEGDSPTLISLRELKRATNNFAEVSKIGEGGFGAVYTGQLKDGSIVAIKRSKREGIEKDKDRFLNEVRILCQVNHRHLVKLLGCCLENTTAVLVMEFISNGTLREHLEGKFGKAFLRWHQRLKIATQTADALNYLHSAAITPIYHRDVKSANILLDNDLNAKVVDFGISKLAAIEATHVSTVAIGTLGYMDPEYYTSFKLTDRSDVYSFGVILLELISAKPVIDFHRVGEETSLVFLATAQIKSGDLQQLVDPSIMETYNDLIGLGRESILKVGMLAVNCLNMSSKPDQA